MPKALQIGTKIGTVVITAAPPSMIQPRNRYTAIRIRRSTYLLLTTLMIDSAKMAGTRAKVRQKPNKVPVAVIIKMVPVVLPVS